jgi:hypothetical protein
MATFFNVAIFFLTKSCSLLRRKVYREDVSSMLAETLVSTCQAKWRGST